MSIKRPRQGSNSTVRIINKNWKEPMCPPVRKWQANCGLSLQWNITQKPCIHTTAWMNIRSTVLNFLKKALHEKYTLNNSIMWHSRIRLIYHGTKSEEWLLPRDGGGDYLGRGKRGLSGAIGIFSILMEIWVKTQRIVHLSLYIYKFYLKRKTVNKYYKVVNRMYAEAFRGSILICAFF